MLLFEALQYSNRVAHKNEKNPAKKHLHSRGRKKGYIVVGAVYKRSGLAENVPGMGGGGG